MAVYDKNGNRLDELSDSIVLKSYYYAEMDDTIQKVRAVNNEPSIVFPIVTDIHRYKATVQTFADMIKNITYFTKEVKCDFVVNTGDTIEGASAKATSFTQAIDAVKDFMNIGVPFLYAHGNHDNNIYSSSSSNQFTLAETFQAFFNSTKDVTYHFSEGGTEYYIDLDGIGVRVVVINACNSGRGTNYAYGNTTASWLTNTALDTDHTVLLFEHLSSIASQVWNNCHGTNADAVESALRAFVTNGGTIVELSGHSHMDMAFIQPWLSVMNVCQKFEVANPNSTNSLKISGFIDVKDAPARTAGTYTEDAWTACVLKPNSGELDCIRFGGGCDRYLHYAPIAPTTLTTRLSDVTWSTSDDTVATVSDGVVTGVASGTCAILAKDTEGNYEAWTVTVS